MSVHLTVRIPRALLTQLDALRLRLSLTRTDAILHAIML